MDVGRGGYTMAINSHLGILESMLEPTYILQQFRACLDRHVFFWPTARDCLKMLDTYTSREPSEAFAVLQCDAYSLNYELRDACINVSEHLCVAGRFLLNVKAL
ncbi:hypothetical protein AZ66_20950 [Paenibacillus sp. E194]|uniref:DUF7002 family protein n=1 Tax=Paenibacillus sp. E194 TaxID=1458845 RepID=UPI0005C99B50|nr:hypothetical protein AZ66_20950 [Paenibacillus sp. E194]